MTSYNVETDQLRGYIISDIGSFDHFAILGLPSQVKEQRHPLLIQVLAVERSLEVVMCDLDYINNHTVVENVTLNRKYADKVAEYRAWWAGWQNRLYIIRQTSEYLLFQLNEFHNWVPRQRVEQYTSVTKRMRSRLERVVGCCESSTVFGQTISNRLSAWQDAVSKPVQCYCCFLSNRCRHLGRQLKMIVR